LHFNEFKCSIVELFKKHATEKPTLTRRIQKQREKMKSKADRNKSVDRAALHQRSIEVGLGTDDDKRTNITLSDRLKVIDFYDV